MTKETITRIKLIASEGYILTDGDNYGKEVYLASGDDGKKWYEITEAEYRTILERQEMETLLGR